MPSFKTPQGFSSKWLVPSLGTLPLIILPILLFIKPDLMLRDPGIGWHLISGHYMLDHRTILNHDIFSFTRPGQPWMVKEWLFQCFAAGLDKIGGLPLLSAVTALIYGSLPVMLYKTMIRKNTNIYIALVMLFVVILGMSAHCHARPHIFTYFFFIILMEKILFYDSGDISAVSLLFFIPAMVLWCNLHGGFMIALVCAGLAFVVTFYNYLRFRTAYHFRKLKIYFLFGTGLTLATLVNPAGWKLHVHLLKYLSSDLLHKWNEFASPDFNNGGATETIFLFLMLGFFVLLFRKKNHITLLEFTFLLFFLYQSLHAIRHIFLFFLLAIPILSRELTAMTFDYDNWFTKRSESILAEQKLIKGDRIYVPILCCLFIGLSLVRPDVFKIDFYGKRLTTGAGVYIKENMEQFKRPFNSMDIGGTLAYHFWPDIKIYADDRLDYYGNDFFSEEYLKVIKIQNDWAKVLEKNLVDSAIITSTPLATLMTESPNWEKVFQDKKTHIFLRPKNNFPEKFIQ